MGFWTGGIEECGFVGGGELGAGGAENVGLEGAGFEGNLPAGVDRHGEVLWGVFWVKRVGVGKWIGVDICDVING